MSPELCNERTQARGSDGSVLLWALLFTVISSAMIITHATYLASSRREMNVRFDHQTLVDNFARAGLTDALVWFQKQPNQPVTAFSPHYAPDADPPLLETIDPTVGLVREFEVRGNLWARYEVRAGEAFDVSSERGIEQAGSVWDIGARAYLYEKGDANAAFDESPNSVVASDYLRSEMRGIPILPPAVAAVSIDDPSRIDLGPLAHIDGGSAPAIAYPAPQPEPPTSPPSGGLLGGLLSPISLTLPLPLPTLSLPGLLVTGTPAALPRVSYEASPPDVFSMQLDQLKSLADYVFEAGDEGAAGARLRGTGGDGNAAAVGAALPLPPQGGGASGGSARGGDKQAETTTASGRAPQGLLSWVTSVVENVGALTSATPTAVVPRLSSTVSTVGIAAVNALGWADAGNARIAAGVGQAPVRTAPRLLRGRAVFVDGGLVLDATTPLEGRALLVVRGDLTVQDGNVSDLQGLVYVTGDAVIDGDFRLAGSLIVRGSLQMGYGSQPVTIQYSQTAIDMLKKDLERYRLSRSIRPGWAR